jgi:hypothetical protein
MLANRFMTSPSNFAAFRSVNLIDSWVDVTRETPSNPDAYDGFHTVHRLYMTAAFRILRAKQQVGGREGVAAFLNDFGVATQRLAPPS